MLWLIADDGRCAALPCLALLAGRHTGRKMSSRVDPTMVAQLVESVRENGVRSTSTALTVAFCQSLLPPLPRCCWHLLLLIQFVALTHGAASTISSAF